MRTRWLWNKVTYLVTPTLASPCFKILISWYDSAGHGEGRCARCGRIQDAMDYEFHRNKKPLSSDPFSLPSLKPPDSASGGQCASGKSEPDLAKTFMKTVYLKRITYCCQTSIHLILECFLCWSGGDPALKFRNRKGFHLDPLAWPKGHCLIYRNSRKYE